ncbi:hypothetical protein ABZX39_33210 [Streptomyces collinus]|uniref:hypothetical protein n=1 Tax=Streptomyces collinus TaxID=42684 RepID=UPI0033ADCC8F
MGTTSTDSDGAAARLRYIQNFVHDHPVTGPAGHSYIPSESRPTAVHSPTPYRLTVLDHISASVDEIAEHTYAANPDAGPVPSQPAAVYDWCHQNTEHAPEADRERLEAIEYRQYLEHAIRAGDDSVVCRHRCPTCRTWGLMWQQHLQRAVCTNSRCHDRAGAASKFTLARLAFEHVATRKNLRQARAT